MQKELGLVCRSVPIVNIIEKVKYRPMLLQLLEAFLIG